MITPSRGIALLIAVILASVVLSVALALLDITYKQVLLASTARQSQYAIYNADSVLECALYWDQQQNAFDYTSPAASITCNVDRLILFGIGDNTSTQGGGIRTTTFSVPCASPDVGTQGTVTVYKYNTGRTIIFSNGYSTCNASDPRRIERGFTVTYGS